MELLKFYNDGCGPCIAVDNFLKDQGVDYTPVNVAKEPAKAAEYNIGFSVPVVILMDGEQEVMRSRGYNGGQLEEMVSILNGQAK